MTVHQIYIQFEKLFPSLAKAVEHCGRFEYEPDTVRLDTTADISLIFHYESPEIWRLETLWGWETRKHMEDI